MLEYPLYNYVRDKFQGLLDNVVIEVLKSFFQLDHHLDISLYLVEAIALRHFKELADLITF